MPSEPSTLEGRVLPVPSARDRTTPDGAQTVALGTRDLDRHPCPGRSNRDETTCTRLCDNGIHTLLLFPRAMTCNGTTPPA